MTSTNSTGRGPQAAQPKPTFRERLNTLRHLGRLVAQIWRTSRWLTGFSIGLRLIRAVQPVAMLFVAKLIIDQVVHLSSQPAPGPELSDWWASGRLAAITTLLILEIVLVIGTDLLSRATSL